MGQPASFQDSRIRLAAFKWLEEQTALHGEVLPWVVLLAGFTFEGQRVPLVSQQGIFKPRVMPELPLSIRTSAEGPYDDAFSDDDTLLYAYRGTDPQHPDNRRLRKAMQQRVPLVYLHGVVPGKYLAVWPVYIVGDDPGALRFIVTADDRRLSLDAVASAATASEQYAGEAELRRRYITREVRQRLHQQGFRERVLRAYREQCALCRLRHPRTPRGGPYHPGHGPRR